MAPALPGGFARLVFIQFFGSRVPPTTSTEDWIPVTCGGGMPRFRRHTQPRVHDRELLSIPIGFEKVSPSFGTTVHNQLELLFTLARNTHPPSSGGFRSTVSLSARVGSADAHSSFGGFAAKRQGMPTVLSASVREPNIQTGRSDLLERGRGRRQLNRVSVTDPSHIAIPVYPRSHSIRTYPTRPGLRPVSGKEQNIRILGMLFSAVLRTYNMESQYQTRGSRQEAGAAMGRSLPRRPS